MKTYSKILVVLILFVSLININTATSQIRFGLKGGFDVSSNRINKDILNASNRLGFQIGGTMEVMAPLVGWGGELSVLYGRQQYNIKGVKDGDLDSNVDLTDYNYLRVPLNLKKKFSVVGLFGVFIAVGPYVEFKLSGGDLEENGNVIDQYKAKSFGAGINAGAGIELINHLELGMYYRKALTNNYDADTPNIGDILKKKPDNWSVNLTYFF